MPKTKVLVIDDEKLVRWSFEQKLSREGYEVEGVPTGEEGLNLIRDDGYDLVLLDLRLPGIGGKEVLQEIRRMQKDIAVVVLTAETGLAHAVECVRLGAHDYLCKPFEFDEVRVALEKALEELKLRREVRRLHDRQRRRFGMDNLVGGSALMCQAREALSKLAESDATTVLIEGENGTGKELAARAIHFGSARSDQPFMDINCSAVPENLFESELFGHERGAFTDAKSARKGLFELADGGTLLLDEVGDMKPSMQAKLLRVLETRRFRRVGGEKDMAVDVRVIASTNKNLDAATARGEFRQDLLYRLKVIAVRLPALRDRREDIPALANFFLEGFAHDFKKPPKQVSPEAVESLQRYDWPGNVRELRNVMERIMIMEAEPLILAQHLPPEIRAGGQGDHRGLIELPPDGVKLADVERELVRQAIERSGGNQGSAARLLGIERDALRRRLGKYGFLDTTGESVR